MATVHEGPYNSSMNMVSLYNSYVDKRTINITNSIIIDLVMYMLLHNLHLEQYISLHYC